MGLGGVRAQNQCLPGARHIAGHVLRGEGSKSMFGKGPHRSIQETSNFKVQNLTQKNEIYKRMERK